MMASSNRHALVHLNHQSDEYEEAKNPIQHYYDTVDEVSTKYNREARENKITSISAAEDYMDMKSSKFVKDSSPDRSALQKTSIIKHRNNVSYFIQKNWLNVLAVIVNGVLSTCIILMISELFRLKSQVKTLTELGNVSCIVSVNNSSTLSMFLVEYVEKLNLSESACSSNVSRYEIQPTLCPLCDYCREESNCTFAKVAELNMTSGNASECPSGFNFIEDHGVRRCENTNTAPTGGCTSIIYVTNMTYSKVYGRITAYQYGRPNSFNPYQRGNGTIDEPYVDGVSLTYGKPRQHIWTFAADLDKNTPYCPCGGNRNSIPEYVKDDYFCDTGEAEADTLASNSPLWDGRECDGSYGCCSYNSPPWFYKQLPYPTSEPIELRVCTDQSTSSENIGLEYILIYVLS